MKIGGYEVQSPTGIAFSETATLGDIITALLKYLYPFAGILVFLYFVWGGFGFLTSGGDPKAIDQAKGKITNAIFGFVILFVAYWIVQIMEYMFKIQVF
jgi:hypothetical protein